MPSATHNRSLSQHSDPAYDYKSAPKRPMADSAPLRDRSAKKTKIQHQPPEEDLDEPIPDPSQMPAVHDDGKKPSFSYATLIGMAILRSPDRRLTLAQIYKWISDTFKFYSMSDAGWQNSIRHNLSLNKSFTKEMRPKGDPGKGHYWKIEPGHERQYYKDKTGRRNTASEGSFLQMHSDSLRPSTAPSLGGLPASSMKNIDSSRFPDENELPSSDATIPASDPAIHDGVDEDQRMPPPSSRNLRSSPPPQGEINSSPPPMPSAAERDGTPPPAPRFPSNSRSGGRKRKFAGLGDSGYYSSIESSLPRGPNTRGMLLPSELDVDHPSFKRGRAEEAILRIRSSSFDSPEISRPVFKQPAQSNLQSSSPFRPFEQPSHTPLTPPVVFKRPAKPPRTVSPNTNLRNHRKRIAELVGSPDKSLSIIEGNVFSPAPNFAAHVDENAFSVWNDEEISKAFQLYGENVPSPAARGSPEKRPAKRPFLGRANTTANILADITNSGTGNARLGSAFPSPKLNPSLLSPMRFESPLKGLPKAPSLGPSPLRPGASEFADDMFVSIHSDDSDEPGFDIMQGFQKIGAAPPAAPTSAPTRPVRPALGRASTSRF